MFPSAHIFVRFANFKVRTNSIYNTSPGDPAKFMGGNDNMKRDISNKRNTSTKQINFSTRTPELSAIYLPFRVAFSGK